MATFNELFVNEVMQLSNDNEARLTTAATVTVEEAAQMFTDWFNDGRIITPDQIETDYVRFGFFTDDRGESRLTWHTGDFSSGRGAKKIWAYQYI